MSELQPSDLTLFWAGVLAFSILMYVILDGFDLGVGILFGTSKDEDQRTRMMGTIAPFWDGNETWLVVVGAGLFATFPDVYAVFLGAFYLPVLLLMVGLIFRGVAFEFRSRSVAMRHYWDIGFTLGSLLAAFVQGAAIGAMILGIPVVDGQYAGDSLGWLHPFPVLTGIGLVLGYSLLGAGWLVLKSEGELRDWAYARIPWLAVSVLIVLGLALAFTIDHSTLTRGNLQAHPWGLALPVIALLAVLGVVISARQRRDGMPFAFTVLFFLAAYLTLGVKFWPYIIPYSITVADAAAPEASLQFLFYGAVVVLPVIAAYTVGVYWVFRGKASKSYGQ